LTGEFLGFEDLVDQIIICETKRDDIQHLMDIGASLKRRCNFDASNLLNPKQYPRNANIFYEMFLEDYNGDLIDVPVLIRNYKYENILDNNDEDRTDK
jgi:hypothetical protein